MVWSDVISWYAMIAQYVEIEFVEKDLKNFKQMQVMDVTSRKGIEWL